MTDAISDRSGPIRILIADDHKVVRAGLAALLRQNPRLAVIADASDGGEAVALFASHRPDVTLMDLNMPILGGIEAIRRMRRIDPGARIIVLSTFNGEEEVHGALDAGAKAYLLKDVDPDELYRAIDEVHAGRTHIPTEITAKMEARRSTDPLTQRELAILREVVQGRSNRAIGELLAISEGTVKSHLKRILSKLDASSRTEAAAIAQRRGIVHL